MKKKIKTKKGIGSIIFVVFFIMSFLIQSNIAALQLAEIFNTDFDTEVESKMTATHIPSCAMSVINQSDVIFEKGYGEQPELDTVYPLYSINKPLLAVAFLQSYDEGLIDLNEDINSYLPFSIRNPNWPDIPITCRHLLSHQSSLNDRNSVSYLDIIVNSTVSYPDYIYELLHENGSLFSEDIWWSYQPGTGSAYSSLDFNILAYILELQSGITLDEYLDENILTPLNMVNTKNNWTEYKESRRAIPYLWNSNINDLEHLDWINLGNVMDYKTTVQDLSILLITLMNGGIYNSVRILNETTVDLMIHDYGDGFGFGIFVNTRIKQDSVEIGYNGNLGSGPGYVLNMYYKENIGVILFTNLSDENGYPLPGIMQLYHYIFEQAFKLNEPTTEESSVSVIGIILFLTVSSGIMLLRRKKHS